MQYAGRGLAGQQVKATLQWLQLTLQKHNSLCHSTSTTKRLQQQQQLLLLLLLHPSILPPNCMLHYSRLRAGVGCGN